MPTPSSDALLLIDSLYRAIANPSASNRWHSLLDLYRAETDDDLKLRVRAALSNRVQRKGVEGFFLATFLFEVTGELPYLAEAGMLVRQIAPCDADRLMAFAVFMWGYFITRGGDRTWFIDVLRLACVPEAIDLLGCHFAAQAKAPLAARPVTAIRKVALVASYIGQDSHVPTPLAFHHAGLLRDLGFEVHLFSAQEMRVQDMGSYLGNNVDLKTIAPKVAELRKMIPEGVEVTLSDERFSLMRRWEDMLHSLAKFDPDLVMFVGLNSPFVAPLFQKRPVLGLCVHAMAPMAPVDVWLTADKDLAGKESTVWGPAIPQAWGHYHPFRVKLKPAGANLTRAELGLMDGGVVLLTVGARLHQEVEGAWAERMRVLLQQHPQVQWLMVGGTALRPEALAEVPHEQLMLLEHREDLRSVMRVCDVYVNPPRLGGGFSVAEAMAEGLPVTALANSDGGDKIGAAAASDIDDYFARLEALIADAGLRRGAGDAMRALFAQTLDLDRSGPSLLEACNVSLARFRVRTGQA